MNALSKLQKGTELTELEQMIQDEMNQDVAAFDLQPERVKIAPGGIGQFVIGEGDTVKTFTAIVALSQKVRGYWPGSGTGDAPLCSSPDGLTGIYTPDPSDQQIADASLALEPHLAVQGMDGPYSCATCPLNQWGSDAKGGRGKACKEMRRLLLLIDGWALPALMSLPPTSIKAWDGYCSGLAARRGAYFAVRTTFELDKATSNTGETYNVVKVAPAGKIEDTEQLRAVAEIRKQYRELVGAAPVVADDYVATDDDESVPF